MAFPHHNSICLACRTNNLFSGHAKQGFRSVNQTCSCYRRSSPLPYPGPSSRHRYTPNPLRYSVCRVFHPHTINRVIRDTWILERGNSETDLFPIPFTVGTSLFHDFWVSFDMNAYFSPGEAATARSFIVTFFIVTVDGLHVTTCVYTASSSLMDRLPTFCMPDKLILPSVVGWSE